MGDEDREAVMRDRDAVMRDGGDPVTGRSVTEVSRGLGATGKIGQGG